MLRRLSRCASCPGRRVAGVLLAAVGLVAGCSSPRTLVMAPYAAIGEGRSTFVARVPEACCEPNFPIIYVTDRAPDPAAGDGQETSFTWRRGRVLRFGVATVSLSPAPCWDELVDRSVGESASIFTLRLDSVSPAGTLRGLGEWISASDNRQVLLPEALEGKQAEERTFQNLVAARLAETRSATALVFVHGFNNTFEHAIFRCAEIWHFSGRDSVPIAYTWPAARGGLRGYTYDRESGEFTIVHLKQMLRALAATPGLERIDIVAHSRGTDVTVTALRELYIEAKADGEDAVASLKLGSLVLAAPDIDMDVFSQRFGAEMLVNAPERTVIYFSPDDDAIWWARWLFDSVKRLGSLVVADLGDREKRVLATLPRLQFVDCEVSGFGTSHAYVFSHPAAMSDLVLVLRDKAEPGTPARPLKSFNGAWLLDNDYLRPRHHPSAALE